MTRLTDKILLISCVSWLVWGATPVQAVDSGGCFVVGGIEFLFPGLGYALLEDWDKAVIFGGLRWNAAAKAGDNLASDDYEEDPDRVFLQEEKDDGSTDTHIFLSRENFFAEVYSSFYFNLGFASIYDLYDKGCEQNNDTYGMLFAPFQFWKFGGELTFWIPTAYISSAPLSGTITYHVDHDLTRQEMIEWSFWKYQLVGVGEEMLFRGVIQRALFNGFSGGFSKPVARWTSIFLASAIFGAAHSGEGFTANSAQAFLFGLYLGWVYHPAEGDFDLEQAIAIHSWWDSIISQRILTSAKFRERETGENAENFDEETTSRYYVPLVYITYRF